MTGVQTCALPIYKCVEIYRKASTAQWINIRVNKDRIHKVPFSNCNHRLAYLRKWHVQKEIDTTNFISLCDNIDASLNFPALFQTFIILFWASRVRLWLNWRIVKYELRLPILPILRYLWSAESSLSTPWLICVWETKFIQYCWMLLNSKKSQEITEVQKTTLKWKVMKRDLMVASTQHHRARLLKYYPIPPCVPILVKLRMIRPLPIYISYILNKYSLSLYVYMRGILWCLRGFWPLGQNPAGAINNRLSAPYLIKRKNKFQFFLAWGYPIVICCLLLIIFFFALIPLTKLIFSM